MGYRKIKQYRSELGLTQGQLAEAAGIKQENVSRYENGKITSTPRENLEAIARALSTKDRTVTVKDLYDGEEYKQQLSLGNLGEKLDKLERKYDENMRLGIGSLINDETFRKKFFAQFSADAGEFEAKGESVQMKVARAHEAQKRERLSIWGRQIPPRIVKEFAFNFPDGIVADYDTAIQTVEKPAFITAPTKDAYAVRMPTDIMSPRYERGDILFVDPDLVPQIGDDVVFKFDLDGTEVLVVRQLVEAWDVGTKSEKYMCSPINEKKVHEDMRIVMMHPATSTDFGDEDAYEEMHVIAGSMRGR